MSVKDYIKTNIAVFLAFILIITTSVTFASVEVSPTAPDGYKLTYIGRYTKVTPVSDGMIAVMVGTTFNGSGKLVNDEKWGFVNADTGKVVVAPKYKASTHPRDSTFDSSHTLRYFDGMARIYVPDKGFAAVDKTGKEIVPFGKYTHISNYYNGIAWVFTENRGWGIINKSGREVVKPGTYEIVGGDLWETFDEGLINVTKIDKKIGDPEYNYCVNGYIDVTGKTVIPFGKYSITSNFSEGLACVSVGLYGTKQYKRFFIDKNGKKVFDVKTDGDYSFGFKDGLCVFNYFDEKSNSEYYGVIDRTGKEIIKPQKQFSEMFWYNNGYIIAKSKQNGSEIPYKYVLLDKNGKVKQSTKVMNNDKDEYFTNASNGLVAKYTGYELIERIGYQIVPLDIGTKNYDVYNLETGKKIIPNDYEVNLCDTVNRDDYNTFYRGGIFPEGMVKIYKPGVEPGTYVAIGYINKNGDVIIPTDRYNNIDFFSEGKCQVQSIETYQWGYVDTSGNEIIKPQFDQATCFRDGKAVVGIYSGENINNDATTPLFDWYVLSADSSKK